MLACLECHVCLCAAVFSQFSVVSEIRFVCSMLNSTDVQNRFFYFGSISVGFLKTDSVWNEFGSVWFKKRGSVRILLFTTRVIAE